jgi:hypothetical protein
VLTYPNFTVIPKDKRQVDIVDGCKIYTPSIYIDSAYIAAGIVVATQTASIQQKKYPKSSIINGNPYVRFDLEQKENSNNFRAKFNPENRLNMDTDLKSSIVGKEGNGFCFRSDTLEKQAFVLTARTLDCKPIYQYLTKNYLIYFMQREDVRRSIDAIQITRAIQNMCNNINPAEKVNPLLMDDESFVFEDGKFFLKFRGVEQPIEIDDINVSDN